jgi:hypothetical protein
MMILKIRMRHDNPNAVGTLAKFVHYIRFFFFEISHCLQLFNACTWIVHRAEQARLRNWCFERTHNHILCLYSSLLSSSFFRRQKGYVLRCHTSKTMSEIGLSLVRKRLSIRGADNLLVAANGFYPFKTRMVPACWIYCPRNSIFRMYPPSVTVSNTADIL